MTKLSGRSGILFGITAGAGLGIIGNFMVVTYYRITDKLGIGSVFFDEIMFFLSFCALIYLFWLYDKRIKQYAEEDLKN